MDNYALVSIAFLVIGLLLYISGQDKEMAGCIPMFFGLVLYIAVPVILWFGGYFSYAPAEVKWRTQKESYGVSVSNGIELFQVKDYVTIEQIEKDSTFTVLINKELFGKHLFKIQF
jgi:hypothetical protein